MLIRTAPRLGTGQPHDNPMVTESNNLARLLIEARNVLDTDRAKAKLYIERAVELVHGRDQPRPAPRLVRIPRGLSSWQAERVKCYIDSNIARRIPVGELAALVRQSMGHFFHTFRESFGESPQAYILRQRVLRAELLIRNANGSLAQIALECGLCDQSHLSRLFRRMTGVTPSAYRREVARPPLRPDVQHRAGSSGSDVAAAAHAR